MSTLRKLGQNSWPDEARWRTAATHVYIIQEGDFGPCKVGISRNAFWRRDDLQSGNHRRLRLLAVYASDDRSAAVRAEAAVLKHFRSHSLSGEWLGVKPDALAIFLDEEFVHGAN